MDEDSSELILRLCTRIGMIMEDTSVCALTLRGEDQSAWEKALSDISDAAAIITVLANAARALHGEPAEVAPARAAKAPAGQHGWAR